MTRYQIKLQTDHIDRLLDLIDLYWKNQNIHSGLCVLFGSVMEELYIKLVRKSSRSLYAAVKPRSITLTPLEIMFLYVIQDYNSAISGDIPITDPLVIDEWKTYMEFDKQINTKLQQHIVALRQILNPITGEHYRPIVKGGVA